MVINSHIPSSGDRYPIKAIKCPHCGEALIHLGVEYKGLTASDGHVSYNEELLRFTKAEARLLECLIKFAEKVIPRETIYQALYFDYPNESPGIKIIDIYLCKTRKKMRDSGIPFTIDTVWGRGLMLKELTA